MASRFKPKSQGLLPESMRSATLVVRPRRRIHECFLYQELFLDTSEDFPVQPGASCNARSFRSLISGANREDREALEDPSFMYLTGIRAR